MTAKEELAALKKKMSAAGVRVVYKDESKFWKFLAWLVKVITFGKNTTFLDKFTTTIGHTIALPRQAETWSDLQLLETFTHEMVHVEQFERFNPFIFSILYLFCFSPIGLAWFRYWAERQAYVAGFRISIKYEGDGYRDFLIDFGVEQMTGANYVWAWPFKASVRKWFEANT